MHSTYNRLSTILSHASTALMVLLGLVAATSYLTLPSPPPGTVDIKTVQVYQERYRPNEVAWLRFDLDADLRPLWTWNTKQVFAYLVVSYADAPNGTLSSHAPAAEDGLGGSEVRKAGNDIVAWDRIVRRQKDARIRIEGGRNKYPLKAVGKKFFGAEPFSAKLMYNVQPWVGLLTYGQAGETKAVVEWPRAQSAMQ
ncbi:signal peptidase complex subunit 3 [Calocera cornea HHB12733]|uniref:Signal peptidase subunit 3 n=1 Tax=Calocera cornea HHB12733 TaxID=1353952 RepID=A0A165DXI3_9BASI|nr:signal peptidase complex subunit 3 [Calocera cornea HHB12733]